MTIETDPGFAAEQLQSIVERIERLHEERQALSDDVSEVYQEAKSNGFDKNAIKAVVKLRAQDPVVREEHAALVDVYMRALNVRAGIQAKGEKPIIPVSLFAEGDAEEESAAA